jgi:hypothetical protein
MRRWALAVGLTIALGAPPAQAQTPDQDSALGSGPRGGKYASTLIDGNLILGGTVFNFAATSDPLGGSPGGQVELLFFGEFSVATVAGPVSCLRVEGNRATIGVEVERTTFPSSPEGFVVSVVDGGPAGSLLDTIVSVGTSAAPTSCALTIPDSFRRSAVTEGDIVVHDAPVRPLFGKTTVGSAFGSLDHNDKYGSRYELSTAGPVTVTKLRAYLDGLGRASGSQLVRGLIYRSTSTGPGALVARTFQLNLQAGRPPGWVDLYFPFRPRLSAGNYWLTLHAGESANVVRYAFDPKAGGQRHNDDLFSNGPLSPFGGSNSAAREMSIHAVGG